MKLIPDAPHWHKFWSIRLALLSAILGALELALPLWQGVVPPKTFAILSTVCAVAAAIARVVQQKIEGRDV
jgi:hypothetical protein